MTRIDLLPLANSAALTSALQALDIILPLRTEGRSTFHTEHWITARLLSTLNKHRRLAFPVSLQHRDTPDFLLIQHALKVGVEATEAVSEQYAAYSALAEREFPDVLLEPSHFKWGTPRKNVEEMRDILRRGRLTGVPWVGERAEEEWALYMESIVRAKLEKLKQADYIKYNETWLSIYNNLALPNVHLQRASVLLLPFLTDVWDKSPTFSRIYVEHGPVILEIQKAETKHLVLEDLW